MIEKLFLSVGAMKAGTTWLHHQLRGHPEIFFTPEKEIHYFFAPTGDAPPMRLEDRVRRFKRVVSNIDPDRTNRRVLFNMRWYTGRYLARKVDDAWYQGLFAHSRTGQWCADFSNLYSLLDSERWKAVRRVATQIRAIYTLRHPLERMWSQLVFFHDFSGAEADFKSWKKQDFARFFDGSREAAHGDYAGNLARLREALSEEELIVSFFEAVRAQPVLTLNRIERFLGISERTYPQERLGRKVNPTAPRHIPKAFIDYAAPIHENQVRRLKSAGLTLPDSWSSAF